MRQAWFLALCRRRLLGVVLAGELAFMGLGCHQPYYYGNSACCPCTTPSPSTVQAGTTVCDEPTQAVEGGTKVSNGATVSSNVSNTKSPRVVLSEPRNSWKASDSDSSAPTTAAEGYINGSTVKQ
jgi:hypothetical protein